MLDWAARHRDQLRAFVLIGALSLFCGGLLLSLRAAPNVLEQIDTAPLAVIFFALLPIVMAISTIDFQLLARLSGAQIGFWRAFEITIYTRAANMLPIPGSMAVRAAALKANGATFKRSGGMMFLLTVIWGGSGFCFSGIWLFLQGLNAYAMTFLSIGTLILIACWGVVWKAKLPLQIIMYAAILRLGMIALEAFILIVALQSIGVNAEYQQTAILVVASFLASFVPAGVGVREALVAALAPLAGIEPAAGFLASAVMRIASVSFLAGLTLLILLLRVRNANVTKNSECGSQISENWDA